METEHTRTEGYIHKHTDINTPMHTAQYTQTCICAQT